MIVTYILAKLDAGSELPVLSKLQDVPGINKASLTYGIYDLCIDMELKTIEELDSFVFNTLRKIPGVKETATLITSQTIKAG